jgi:two-component system nitrogen regulation response regulator GlnG
MASGQEVLPSDLPPEIHQDTKVEIDKTTGNWDDMLSDWADTQLHSGHQNILTDALYTFEKTLLERALHYTHGHKQDAAKKLGWGRNTLTRKLKDLDM